MFPSNADHTGFNAGHDTSLDPATTQLRKWQHINMCDTGVQMTSRNGHVPSLVTMSTDDAYWKAIRKGVAPAFSPANIRQVASHLSTDTVHVNGLVFKAAVFTDA